MKHAAGQQTLLAKPDSCRVSSFSPHIRWDMLSTGLESLLTLKVCRFTPENVDEFLHSWFGLLAVQRLTGDDGPRVVAW